jgi:replicative DNA helicase
MCVKYGIKLAVIDYLQKLRAKGGHEKRTYEVGEVSGTCKSIAVHNKIAVLSAAQLNREPDKDKGRKPRMSDLADSSQIERDADTIMLLHRQDNEAGLIVAKQRDGEVGEVKLNFIGQYCQFTSAIREQPEYTQ